MSQHPFPALHLDQWSDSKDTLHLMLQIVGKIRLHLFPKKNHWWHVTFYVSVNGLTTGPIPYGNQVIEMEFNFVDHHLHLKSSTGNSAAIPMANVSVAKFYEKVFDGLKQLDIEAKIIAKPYDVPHIPFETFQECHDINSYDKPHIETMWQILVAVNNVFQDFHGRFIGKSTPVHLFWHHFDMALTRFSGKRAPERPNVSQVEREAYSHEVISFGFWFGDETFPEPAFYAYGFPGTDIDGVYDEKLEPDAAFWNQKGGQALLKYSDIRDKDNARELILSFLESTYQAYAKHMDWPLKEFELDE